VAYFNMLSAPSKTLIWFEESEHEPFVDEADKFNTLIAELVRPVADVTWSQAPARSRADSWPGRSLCDLARARLVLCQSQGSFTSAV
jgi:hypothetical protein